MHHIQVACIARHGLSSAYLLALPAGARRAAAADRLGDVRGRHLRRHALEHLRASSASGGRFKLDKDATTVSLRRARRRHARHLPPRRRRARRAIRCWCWCARATTRSRRPRPGTRWACAAPAARASSSSRPAPDEQIVPGSFADASAQTMVPYSHILWAALWLGIAADALSRAPRLRARRGAQEARAPCRRRPRASPRCRCSCRRCATTGRRWPPSSTRITAAPERHGRAADHRLGAEDEQPQGRRSEPAPQIVHQALQIVGISGYKNDSKFSVGRHYRDALSARADDLATTASSRRARRCCWSTRTSDDDRRTTTPQTFYEGLVEHGLIVPVGVPGAFGRGAVFEDVLERFNALDHADLAQDDGAEVLHLPARHRPHDHREERLPRLVPAPRRHGVQLLRQRARRRASSSSDVHAGEPWGDTAGHDRGRADAGGLLPGLPDASPARCPEGGRLVTMTNWVFRHEPSPEPTRMQSFRVREFVRAGTPDEVVDVARHVAAARPRAAAAARPAGAADVAADPFFGRGGKMLADEPEGAEAQVRGAGAGDLRREARPRSARSTTTRTTSAASFEHPHRGRRGRAHRLPRLRPRAHRDGAVQDARLRSRPSGRRRCASSSGHDAAQSQSLPTSIATTYQRARAARRGRASGSRRTATSTSGSRCCTRSASSRMAMLPFTVAIDFEGDQWTFFKPPHDELLRAVRRRRAGAQRLAAAARARR